MKDGKSSAVVDAVWRWRGGAAEREAGLRAKRHRDSFRQSVILITVGSIFIFALHWRHMGIAGLVLAVVILVSGRFVPALYDGLQKFVDWVGRMIGTGLTWILLTPFFYLCFAPAHLVLKMRGKDPMNRRFRPDSATYWTDYSRRSADHFERQF